MKWTRIIALLGTLSLISNVAAAAGSGADDYESAPKYGDPAYQTIWSRASEDQRAKFGPISEHAARRGWEYLGQGDLETAIRRFNQSWTLHPANASALWGMGIVQFERARQLDGKNGLATQLDLLDQAVRLLDEAARLPSPEASLLNDEAMLLINRGSMREELHAPGRDADFQQALTLLERAEALEPNPMIYDNWAELERRRGHPDLAERFAARARTMRAARVANR